MTEEQLITEFDPAGFINDELIRIRALALSIIAIERADLENVPIIDISFHEDELANMILEQVQKIREKMAGFGKGHSAGQIEEQPTQVQ